MTGKGASLPDLVDIRILILRWIVRKWILVYTYYIPALPAFLIPPSIRVSSHRCLRRAPNSRPHTAYMYRAIRTSLTIHATRPYPPPFLRGLIDTDPSADYSVLRILTIRLLRSHGGKLLTGRGISTWEKEAC